MADVRRIIIIFVIAVLFSVFVFTSIDAVYPSPDYSDFCNEIRAPKLLEKDNCDAFIIPTAEEQACYNKKGMASYTYDSNGCAIDWECNMCNKYHQDARENHNFWVFIIATALGLIAIIISLYLPMEKNSVHEWVGSGLMLGGMFCVFFGTVRFFGDLHRWVRPIIILLELLLVIYLAYRKLAPQEPKPTVKVRKVTPKVKTPRKRRKS